MEKFIYLETQMFLYNYTGLLIKKRANKEQYKDGLFNGFTAYLIKRKSFEKTHNELEKIFTMKKGTNTNNALVAILEKHFKDAIKSYAEHKHKRGYEPLEFYNTKRNKFQKFFSKSCRIEISPLFSFLCFRYFFNRLEIDVIPVMNTPTEKVFYFEKHI